MTDNKNKKINILGLPIHIIFGILFIFCITAYLGFRERITLTETKQEDFNPQIWHKMICILLFSMVLSGIFKAIGKNTPILRNIGGGAILCLLVPSFIFTFPIIKSSEWTRFTKIFKDNRNFVNKDGLMAFSQFFVAFLVAGSLLSINKNVLKNAIKKFLPLVVISLFISASVVGTIGFLLKPIKDLGIPGISPDRSFVNAICFIFIPISCGGITCGIVPLTKIMSQGNAAFEEKFSSIIMPSLIVGGIMSVIVSGLIKTFFKNSKYNSPTGQLEKEILFENKNTNIKKTESKEENISDDKIKTGFIIVFALYILSSLLRYSTVLLLQSVLKNASNLVPPVIVFLVLIIFLLKLSDLIPSYYVERVNQASKFVTTHFSDAMLIIVGIGLNFNTFINKCQELPFIITCLCCVITTASAAAFLGNKMGYYPVQSSISAGLCANSIGGAGNLAILEASDSKQLMPFAQISTRIGGDIIVIVASIIFPIFYKLV